MKRSLAQVRDAVPDDASALLALWSEFGRWGHDDPLTDAENAIAQIAVDPDERLLIALVHGVAVGAVHLRRGPISPLAAEPAVHVSHLHVHDDFRRQGIGHAMMEAAVTWAEEKDISCVLAVSASNSREANRFMARLGLGQVALVRAASTKALRSKLLGDSGRRPAQGGGRPVGHVLAARRMLRRRQSVEASETP